MTGPVPAPRPLHPRVRLYWWTRGAVRAALLTGFVAVLDLGVPFGRPLPAEWVVGVPTLVVGAAAWLVALAVPPVAYRRWRFALRHEDLWIRRGIVVRTVSVIPYRRLQFVDTEQGPLARLFGLAELVVHTAALGTSGRVPGLDAAEAEELRERLAHLEPGDDEPT